tara:strand:- start:263 stop:766 length:504 start_codon:yes stop_codon:yes gene_type:complete
MISDKVDALTLQYFMNNKFEKSVSTDKEDTDTSITVEDKKFYKKRIIQLTKDLFKKSSPNDDIDSTFNDFLYSCISYFKFVDASEVLQEEYDNVDTNKQSKKEEYHVNPNEILYNKPAQNNNTLDSFVTNKTVYIDEKILPQKKSINITSTKFKTKGIKQKNKKENS